jgi:hypothetical protein
MPWRAIGVVLIGLIVSPCQAGTSAQTGATIPATIAGHVTDAHSVPVISYSVIVFPTDRTKWSAGSGFVKIGTPSEDGGFEISGLAPGEYWVAAVDAIAANSTKRDWEKPAVLDMLSTRATRVMLAERERRLTMLRVITR